MKRKISIINLNVRIDIIVDKIKLICGNDFESRDKIKKVLNNRFNKLTESDYAQDKHKSSVLVDDEPIAINDYLYFCVDSSYDLVQDTKLGTKSLALEYINSIFKDVEYTDEYQTINSLFTSLLDEKTDESDYYIRPYLDNLLSKKMMVKLLEFSFLNDDSIINNYDLTLEERIMIQLNMIKAISLRTEKKVLVLLDTPKLTSDMFDIINNINGQFLIIFNLIVDGQYENVLILDDIKVDLDDENQVYETANSNNTAYYTIEEMKSKILNDYLSPRLI